MDLTWLDECLCRVSATEEFSIRSLAVRIPPANSIRAEANASAASTGSDPDWLDRFHRGDRETMASCYREHFHSVDSAVGRVLRGADKETVVHDVFFRLLSKDALRTSFRGGAFGSWLATVARNQAIDYWRQRRREQSGHADTPDPTDSAATDPDTHVEFRLFVERFRMELLPPKWHGVFDARFLDQLDQREAARRLGISRTTLAYQELQIRLLLRRYVRRGQLG